MDISMFLPRQEIEALLRLLTEFEREGWLH
jgi:hypothetical protein